MNIKDFDPLRRLAAKLLNDPSDRDDAVQDALLTGLATSKPKGNSASWYAGVLRNKARRIWSRRSSGFNKQLSLEAEPGSSSPEPGENLDREFVRELLHSILDCLPEAQSEVLRLRFFEDLGPEEIAERVGRPSSTVKTQLARGLAGMRTRLDQRTGDRRLTALPWWMRSSSGLRRSFESKQAV